MKVSSEKLNNALSTASKWVPQKPIIDATGGYLFAFDDGVMSISAIDPVGSDITLNIPFEGEPLPESILVKAKQLNTTIRSMANISDTITMDLKKNGLVLKCAGHRTVISTMSPDEFPELRTRDSDKEHIIDPQEFAEAVLKMKGVASPDDPRRNLSCIYFKDGDVVATDGRRMAIKYGFDLVSEEVLVPIDFCNDIASALANIVCDVSVYYDEDVLYFEWDGGAISTSLVEMNYPDYEQMVPQSYATEVKIASSELKTVLSMAAPFAVDSENLLIVRVDEDGISIESGSESGGHTSKMEGLEITGESVVIGLSYRYLNDAINAVGGNVHIGINGPTGIVILSGSDDYLYGMMPMHITE